MALFPTIVANGTTLEAMDSKWNGASGSVQYYNGVLTNINEYDNNLCWYENAQGDTQEVQAIFKAYNRGDGAQIQLVIQANATQTGYHADLLASGEVDIERNNAFVTRLGTSGSLNPVTNDVLMRMVYTHTTGVLQVYLNGSLIGSLTDGVPLTGGYPGLNIYATTNVTNGPAFDEWTDNGMTGSGATIPTAEGHTIMTMMMGFGVYPVN